MLDDGKVPAPLEPTAAWAYLSRVARAFIKIAILTLALLLAPAGMFGGQAAMAMPHETSSVSMSHCLETQAPGDEERQMMLDCAMACTAMPSAAPLLPPARAVLAALPVSGPVQFFEGTRPEAATPPPRSS